MMEARHTTDSPELVKVDPEPLINEGIVDVYVDNFTSDESGTAHL